MRLRILLRNWKKKLYSGRVYKISKSGKWQLYVPVDLRYDVVSNIHRELIHLDVDKRLGKIKEFYYFPKMPEFVSQCVSVY